MKVDQRQKIQLETFVKIFSLNLLRREDFHIVNVIIWELQNGPLEHNFSVTLNHTVSVPVETRNQHPDKSSIDWLVSLSFKDNVILGQRALTCSTGSFTLTPALTDQNCCVPLTPLHLLSPCLCFSLSTGSIRHYTYINNLPFPSLQLHTHD